MSYAYLFKYIIIGDTGENLWPKIAIFFVLLPCSPNFIDFFQIFFFNV